MRHFVTIYFDTHKKGTDGCVLSNVGVSCKTAM